MEKHVPAKDLVFADTVRLIDGSTHHVIQATPYGHPELAPLERTAVWTSPTDGLGEDRIVVVPDEFCYLVINAKE